MYETSFGFTRPPFTDPDATDFEPCGVQAAVLAGLHTALDAGTPLIVLSGPIGTGKTTLLRRELGRPSPRRHAVLFWNAHIGFDDLLNYLGDDLGLRAPGTSRTERIKALRTALVRGLSEGWTLLIAVDDAQNLPDEALAGLHTLLDLREVGHGLVQVLLCGQPELQERLARDPQRDAHPVQRLGLRTLDAAESVAFITARLAAAGRTGIELFDAEALARIHELAHGVPRLLNRICNQSLLLAYLGSEPKVTAALVRDVAADTPPTEAPPQPGGPLYEPMPARPAIAAESVPHIRTPDLPHHAAGAADPAATALPAHEAPAAALPPLHADPLAHGHRPPRARRQFWLGLAAIVTGVAIAGFAAWRNGWLPLPAPTQPVVRPAGPQAPATLTAPPASVASPTPQSVPAPATPAATGTPAGPRTDAAVTPPAAAGPSPSTPAPVAGPAAGGTAAPAMPAAPAASPAAAAPDAAPAATDEVRAAAVTPPPAVAETRPVPATTPQPPAAEAPSPGPMADDAVASAVRALLAEARTQYAGMRYTQPPGDNALQTWRQVLTLTPGNAEALAGLATLRTRFIGWGRQAQARGDYERALRHYEIARGIGEDDELLGLITETRRRRDGR